MVPLLPKLRGHFAEFLNHSSPDRLSILYLTTCVGLGYGPDGNIARCFSRQHRITNIPQQRGTHHASPTMHSGFTYHAGYTLTPQSTQWLGYLPVSHHRLATTRSDPTHPHQQPPQGQSLGFRAVSITDSPRALPSGYQNINWLSIDYACRPRLRSRLTLGRLA